MRQCCTTWYSCVRACTQAPGRGSRQHHSFAFSAVRHGELAKSVLCRRGRNLERTRELRLSIVSCVCKNSRQTGGPFQSVPAFDRAAEDLLFGFWIGLQRTPKRPELSLRRPAADVDGRTVDKLRATILGSISVLFNRSKHRALCCRDCSQGQPAHVKLCEITPAAYRTVTILVCR